MPASSYPQQFRLPHPHVDTQIHFLSLDEVDSFYTAFSFEEVVLFSSVLDDSDDAKMYVPAAYYVVVDRTERDICDVTKQESLDAWDEVKVEVVVHI